jgi:hypothetical protein
MDVVYAACVWNTQAANVQDVRYAAGAWMHRSGAYMDVVYVPKGQEPEGTRISLGMREILLSMDAQERRTWT